MVCIPASVTRLLLIAVFLSAAGQARDTKPCATNDVVAKCSARVSTYHWVGPEPRSTTARPGWSEFRGSTSKTSGA